MCLIKTILTVLWGSRCGNRGTRQEPIEVAWAGDDNGLLAVETEQGVILRAPFGNL